MKAEKWREYAYKTISIAGLCALIYVAVRYGLVLALPFLLAWAVAFAMRPVAAFFHRSTHLSLRLCRVFSSLLFILLLLGGVLCLVILLGAQLWRFLSGISEGDLSAIVDFLLDPLGGAFSHMEGMEALSKRLAEAADNVFHEGISAVASAIAAIVGAVPRIFLFSIVTVIATVYISYDLERVNHLLLSLLNPSARQAVRTFLSRFCGGVWPYVRSYLILMLLTFFIMTVGLVMIGSEYALLLAVIIALVDPLPIVGVGTVLIPWSLFHLFFGNTGFGIGLLVLYVIHEIFRQVAEPRILGKSMGIHPLLTLVLLYVGYSLLGLLGLLLLPVLTVGLQVFLTSFADRQKKASDSTADSSAASAQPTHPDAHSAPSDH